MFSEMLLRLARPYVLDVTSCQNRARIRYEIPHGTGSHATACGKACVAAAPPPALGACAGGGGEGRAVTYMPTGVLQTTAAAMAAAAAAAPAEPAPEQQQPPPFELIKVGTSPSGRALTWVPGTKI
jgi:hypothetical protein